MVQGGPQAHHHFGEGQDRTGEVTETELVALWRTARKTLGRYRRQRMTSAQATLVAVVRRVLAEAPATMPAVFLSTTFWERIRRERGHRQTWRAYANQFQRAHGARTPQAALAALRALAPPRPTA